MRNCKGFSRLEMVLAILIATILVAVLLPRFLHFASDSEQEMCELNRSTILRLYQAHILIDPDCSLSDVLDGSCTDFEDDTSDYTCPSGGEYTATDNEHITCSKHG